MRSSCCERETLPLLPKKRAQEPLNLLSVLLNQVLEMHGRKLNDNLRKGTAYHLYLPASRQGVFNIEALENSKEIILCESLIDALTFWSAGYRNVTSSYGIEGFTPAHMEVFKQYKFSVSPQSRSDRQTAGSGCSLAAG